MSYCIIFIKGVMLLGVIMSCLVFMLVSFFVIIFILEIGDLKLNFMFNFSFM